MNIQMLKLKLMAVFIYVFFNNSLAIATVTLPWSTTHDCAEWIQGQPVNCDGLTKAGDWTTADGSRSQITTAANNPLGNPNTRGRREWYGDGNNGWNDNSGGLLINFTEPENEFWVRFYIRFEEGYTVESYGGLKLVYFKQPGGQNANYIQTIYDVTNDRIRYYEQISRAISWYCDQCGWRGTHGDPSRGEWHCYEVYFKRESTTGGTDGIIRIWVDGVLKLNKITVQHGSAIQGLGIPSNLYQYKLGNRDMYVDVDDFVITDITPTGRDVQGNPMIGPINSVPQPTILSSPRSLHIISN